jgi:hypothetical protein
VFLTAFLDVVFFFMDEESDLFGFIGESSARGTGATTSVFAFLSLAAGAFSAKDKDPAVPKRKTHPITIHNRKRILFIDASMFVMIN